MKKNITSVVQGQLELVLPYTPLDNIAGRARLREVATLGRQSAYIDIDNVVIRGTYEIGMGFNPRFKPEGWTLEQWYTKLKIEETAYSILENGLNMPLEGDLLEDGTFALTDGFRRTLAIRWLLKNGYTHYKQHAPGKDPKPLRMVEILTNPSHWTELDRVVRSLTSEDNLKYDPMEIAIKIKLMKDSFKMSNEAIGKRLGNKSRQYVDNMLHLAGEPLAIQNAVAAGDITSTAVLALRQNEKDPEIREEIIKKAIESGDRLSVKDATAHRNEYHDYKERLTAIKEQYAEGLVTYTAAILLVKELAAKAIDAKADDKKSIEFALKAIIEMIDDVEVTTEEEDLDTYKQYDFSMADIILNMQNDETPELDGMFLINKIRTEAVKLFPEKIDHIDFCLINYHQCIHDFKGTGNENTGLEPLAYKEQLSNIIDSLKDDPTKFMAGNFAVTKCRLAHIKASLLYPVAQDSIDIELGNAISDIAIILAESKRVDTISAIGKEVEFIRTADKQEVYRPKQQKDDALMPIDFTRDKEMGEFELNEAIKLGDKLSKQLDSLPKHMEQYKKDWQGLIFLQQSKITLAIEIIKRAANTR